MAIFADSRVKIFPLLFFPHLSSVLNPLPTFQYSFQPAKKKKKKIDESFLLAHVCPSVSVTGLKGQKAELSSNATLSQAK